MGLCEDEGIRSLHTSFEHVFFFSFSAASSVSRLQLQIQHHLECLIQTAAIATLITDSSNSASLDTVCSKATHHMGLSNERHSGLYISPVCRTHAEQ